MQFREDTPYQLFVKKENKENAVKIIKEGLEEYIPSGHFLDYEDDECFYTPELCVTPTAITFATLISNLDKLLKLSVDGRGSNNKIKVVFGVENKDDTFCSAESILEQYCQV